MHGLSGFFNNAAPVPAYSGFSKQLMGDFNGDGLSDVAFFVPDGQIHVVYSAGQGSWGAKNVDLQNPSLYSMVSDPSVKKFIGDLNGDHRDDILIVGNSNWPHIFTATWGGGSFQVREISDVTLNSIVFASGVEYLFSDFDNDKKMDLGITRGPGWWTLPVAHFDGNGGFTLTNNPVGPQEWYHPQNFNTWSKMRDARVLKGDFNGDGLADVALAGGYGWSSIAVAFSNADKTWSVTNVAIASYPDEMSNPARKIITGDFNGDGKTDLAFVGGNGDNIYRAISNGNGSFNIETVVNKSFQLNVRESGVQVISED